MSKIVQPFGILASEIRIKADHKGLVVVEAWIYRDPNTGLMLHPKVPMDSRVMVQALQKIVMDYCAGLFGMIGSAPVANSEEQEKTNDGQKGNGHDKAGG